MGWLPQWPTETLASIKTILDWFLVGMPILAALLLALAGGLRVFVDRELGRRRVAEDTALRKQVTLSKQDAEAARKEAEKLRERLKDRDVPAQRRGTMLGVLRRIKGTVDIRYGGDAETKRFAERLGGLLREAGWSATETGGAPLGVIIGLSIETAKGNPESNVLKEALEIAFPNVQVSIRHDVREGEVRLVVGVKPEDNP